MLRKMRVEDPTFIRKIPVPWFSQRAVRGKPVATIHHQHLATNKTATLRTNKQCRLLNISDSAETSQRNVLLQLLSDCLGNEPLHSLSILDWTRRNRVHANPITSPLNRQIARQRINTSLRCGNVKLHRRAEVMQRRTDVQNLSAILFELRKCRPTNVERSFQVDIHNRAKSVR